MKLLIDNWRLADVPFYLRTGKTHASAHKHIGIQFPARLLWSVRERRWSISCQTIGVAHPAGEGISLQFAPKWPGPVMRWNSRHELQYQHTLESSEHGL